MKNHSPQLRSGVSRSPAFRRSNHARTDQNQTRPRVHRHADRRRTHRDNRLPACGCNRLPAGRLVTLFPTVGRERLVAPTVGFFEQRQLHTGMGPFTAHAHPGSEWVSGQVEQLRHRTRSRRLHRLVTRRTLTLRRQCWRSFDIPGPRRTTGRRRRCTPIQCRQTPKPSSG